MKIGIVLYPTYGGSGVVATELGKAMAEQGHCAHFISYKQPFRLNLLEKNIAYHEVLITDYPLFEYQPYELLLSSKLVEVVLREKLDILHVHYAIPHATAAFLAQQILKTKGIHIPFVTTLHGTDITLLGKDSSFEPAITFAINQSNAVTAVSESLKSDTLMYFDVQREIEVIPNFVCPDLYGRNGIPKNIKEEIAPNNEPILIHVSNFRKVKRVDDVIKVFAEISKKMNAKLLLVGEGPERHNVEDLARSMGLMDNIRFMGKIKETEGLLLISDLFLLTSEFESFGLAALEAMAAGLPVVSTNGGGLPEVNLHGETGFLCNVGDVEDMAQKCLEILSDKTLYDNMKKGVAKRAEHFSINKIQPMYTQLYNRLIHEHIS